MRVTELQQVCEMQGLEYEGLNKRGLISTLQRHAMRAEEDEERNGEIKGNGMQDVLL